MNETLTVGATGTTLRMERRLAHRPEKVWRAVTEPEHLDQWFPFTVEVDLRVGGEIRFIDRSPSPEPVTHGVVTHLDAPHLFAFTWGEDNSLRFDLEPDGDGCLLVFTHTFRDHYGAASFTAGWGVCFDAMEAVLDGRSWSPPADMAEPHDAYVAAFGLDEGTVERTGERWRVRFERQLTRPLDTVWSALTSGGTPEVGAAPPPAFTAAGVPAGPVTMVEEPKVVEYDWQAGGRRAGRVRWELGQGTGQGPRLVITQTGPAEHDQAVAGALRAWRSRIAELAGDLRAISPASPPPPGAAG